MSQTATPIASATAAATPQAASDMAQSPAAQSQPPLPAPQAFDILPPLHALLARLEPGLESYTASRSAPLVTGVDSEPLIDGTEPPPLPYKDAPVAASFVKARIRKTLAELKGLGDMHRTVEEQEAEIKELEAKIAAQRDMLMKMGREAEGMTARVKGEMG